MRKIRRESIRRRQVAGRHALYDLPDLPNGTTRKPKRINRYLRTAVLLILVLLGFSTKTAWTADSQAQSEERSGWGLGLGVGVMQKAYRNIDNESR